MRKRDLSLEKRSGAKPRLPVIEDDVEIGAGSAIATHL